ncbi:MAG: aminotransferase class I/II-fold pyridoxal phosphate-dependent enzyme [Thermodesulfobacteriota bacterium]|nr:aminotransferase class I/II-fold pyridoxal phosphate-dependent enzyme [Thermodesulfobacteriota bacterium]
MTDLQFGKEVYEYAIQLGQQGKDANQIAKVLYDQDSNGYNYGIGIILNANGKPMDTSSILVHYSKEEIENSKSGNYMSSNAIIQDVKTAVLSWQRIPEEYWPCFKLALPSDAGTGAVKTGVEIALMLDSRIHTLGIEELGWPAYKAIAKIARIQCKEYPEDGVFCDEGVLSVYQAGPMNTTGLIRGRDIIDARAQAAAKSSSCVVLDRAYSGFEFARLLAQNSFSDIMRMSYELQIRPFIERGVTFCLAISPTKSFITFALRPCGLLLIYCPDESREKEVNTVINSTIRARGSAFEHAVTRAFAKAITKDLSHLEAEHQSALERVAEAEAMWRELVKGTPIEYLYSENFAGLFRNPKSQKEAAIHIYNEHIYPVFSQQRCRQNITGIPDDRELAHKHVSVFAKQCY